MGMRYEPEHALKVDKEEFSDQSYGPEDTSRTEI